MDALIIDYEQVLIGNREAVSPLNFYGAAPGGANQNRALTCIRYVIENILQWDIEEAKRKFDMYMIRLMKLERIVEYIEYPPEVPIGDGMYILSLLYPEIKLNQKSLIENIYQKVLDGEAQFPREYFLGQKGYYRFCVCLCYLISNHHPFSELEDLYQFFSSTKGKTFLDKHRLKVPMEHLNIEILKCIRTITEDDENTDLYYHFYKFIEELEASRV